MTLTMIRNDYGNTCSQFFWTHATSVLALLRPIDRYTARSLSTTVVETEEQIPVNQSYT